MKYAICVTRKTTDGGICTNLIVGKIYKIIEIIYPINSSISLIKIDDGTESWNFGYYSSDQFKLITRKEKLERILK